MNRMQRKDCPICRSSGLLGSVHFDAIPVLCNVLYPNATSARDAATGQFDMSFCRECSHVFNAAFDEDIIGYTQNYENSLHFSPRFAAFACDLARRLNETYSLRGKTVVDIGCGKGDFLRELCTVSGARCFGFDKSYEGSCNDETTNIEFVKEWFSDAYSDVRPDFVSCRHVLEHIATPIEFLRTLGAHPGIGSETVFYIEVPNALYTVRNLGIWDLIY
jgi:2-polyprenyl-3-methyl-5-hydroxy-6-metoxy-1,4-benzoquinol methylase